MGLKASRIRVPGPAGHDDPAAAALCTRAAAGDQGAWDDIVERYAPMVWSIGTRFRLAGWPPPRGVSASGWRRRPARRSGRSRRTQR
jgi:hypothetical protein